MEVSYIAAEDKGRSNVTVKNTTVTVVDEQRLFYFLVLLYPLLLAAFDVTSSASKAPIETEVGDHRAE